MMTEIMFELPSRDDVTLKVAINAEWLTTGRTPPARHERPRQKEEA